MSIFPPISSGAVTQYPATVQYSQSAQVIEYLDGSQQRYLLQPRMFRAWRINLTQLSEDEIQNVETFFAAQLGTYSTFTFPDPFTGKNVQNCRYVSSFLTTTYVDVDDAEASFWVIETNG